MIDRWLLFVTRHPWLVIAVLAILSVLSVQYAARHLGVNTDPVAMLDETLPFRQVQNRFRSEFPGLTESLLLVIEAPTPEQAQAAAADVYAALEQQAELFPRLFWPGASDYLRQHGLLLLTLDDLDALDRQLSAAQPLLASLARDPTLVGLLDLLVLVASHDGNGDLDAARQRIAAALERSLDGEGEPLSWQRLLSGTSDGEDSRESILVEPRLDYDRVMSGRAAMEAVDAIRSELGLDSGPVRLRITGNVALMHEELVTSLRGAETAGLLAFFIVMGVMAIGLRSLLLVLVALLSLLCGFALTLGYATVSVGRINLVSIAFAVLYIGLGVNYAIHFLLRYREQLAVGRAREEAVRAGGVNVFAALALSALTTAVGFLAFAPTAYAGVAELGIIASGSMLITLAVTYSLIPALLSCLPIPKRLQADAASALPPALLSFPLRYRRHVTAGAVLTLLVASVVAVNVQFDSDPLNLRDPDAESLRTLRTLLSAADSGYRNLQLLADGPETVAERSRQLQDLSEVGAVVSLLRFVPEQQEIKLEVLEDLRFALGFELLEAEWTRPPADAESVHAAAIRLRTALGDDAAGLQRALDRLEARLATDPGFATVAHDALLSTLPVTMGRLTEGLQADTPVRLEDIPQSLRRQWIGRSGSWLIQIFPRDPALGVDELGALIAEVRSVDASVTGTPVLQTESGAAVAGAFRQAIVWAIVGILLIVLLVLRDLRSTLAVLTPLFLGGILTIAFMVAVKQPFNFANVIAIPLLLGVAVDNGIHLVLRHRAGAAPSGNVLATHTARAIVFGALTTALTFGNLMVSRHAGTSSMGMILAVGLPLMVLATLIVLPAILGRTSRPAHG